MVVIRLSLNRESNTTPWKDFTERFLDALTGSLRKDELDDDKLAC